MSDKFGEGRDPYLYPGLDIMRNRLNIRQQQRLEQAAYEMTALRAATIELGPLVRGLPHLRTIHRQLYQDIFDWAGQLRDIRRQLVLPTRANYTGRTLQCDIKSRLLLPSLSFSCSFHLSVRTYIRDGSAGLPPPPP
ncbi:hypothetical protein WG3_04095 [Escherichia coli KTE36]|nr:hypothetical protein WG3_04095 [Escherichia coli KTE36]